MPVLRQQDNFQAKKRDNKSQGKIAAKQRFADLLV